MNAKIPIHDSREATDVFAGGLGEGNFVLASETVDPPTESLLGFIKPDSRCLYFILVAGPT